MIKLPVMTFWTLYGLLALFSPSDTPYPFGWYEACVNRGDTVGLTGESAGAEGGARDFCAGGCVDLSRICAPTPDSLGLGSMMRMMAGGKKVGRRALS